MRLEEIWEGYRIRCIRGVMIKRKPKLIIQNLVPRARKECVLVARMISGALHQGKIK